MAVHKKKLVTLGLLIASVAGLAVSVTLLRQPTSVSLEAAGENSGLSFAQGFTNVSQARSLNEIFEVPIYLRTDNETVNAVDMIINFDKSRLSLEDIITNPYNTNFKTFAPLLSTGAFDIQKVKSEANTTGTIQIGAVTFAWPSQVLAGFKGAVQIATLKYKVLAMPSNTSISFAAQSGNTTDTNIVSQTTGADLLTNPGSQLTSLTITARKIGDINGDGIVGQADYGLMLTEIGKAGANQADLDGNGTVNLYDFNILIKNFGL